ncbi:terminase small subunit [Micromonospora eburnea]|uniref:terminase small subunit n=1 Tax=Micromonospora eburnea TaxID=227316 RepID=UPI00114CF571|nr:hypothetical protein [Micromonospora eburnea]
MTISSKLRLALQETPRLPRDAATVELALTYARQLDRLIKRLGEEEAIDSPVHHKRVITEVDIIGRRLEATLDRLGMSPGARPAVRGGGQEAGGDPASGQLDQLRADAAAGGGGAAGLDYTEAVDPAVTAADAGD